MEHLPPSRLIQSKPTKWSLSRLPGQPAASDPIPYRSADLLDPNSPAGNRFCSGCSGDYEDPERSAPDPDAPGTDQGDGCSVAMDPDRVTLQIVLGE